MGPESAQTSTFTSLRFETRSQGARPCLLWHVSFESCFWHQTITVTLALCSITFGHTSFEMRRVDDGWRGANVCRFRSSNPLESLYHTQSRKKNVVGCFAATFEHDLMRCTRSAHFSAAARATIPCWADLASGARPPLRRRRFGAWTPSFGSMW